MCIFVASAEHPEYALILLSNRDELLNRVTAPARQWPGTDLYAPQDLRRGGTWMGLTRGGRLASLVNFSEEAPESPFSRGDLPVQFLLSSDRPAEWLQDLQSHHAEALASAGGFSMLFGALELDPQGQLKPLTLISNRQNTIQVLSPQEPTIAVSNGLYEDPTWTKTERAKQLFKPLLKKSGQDLVDSCFDLLSIDSMDPSLSPPEKRAALRTTIFVAPFDIAPNEPYLTRTQTVVLVDKQGNVEYIEQQLHNDRQLHRMRIADLAGR